MLAQKPKMGRWRTAACALLLLPLLLTACGGQNANATPTQGVQAIYTAAFETLMAQQATQQALTPPTSTPEPPTPLPTLALASPLPTLSFSTSTPGGVVGGGGSGACDSSAFISDVTIPDNSTIDPGKTFTKTWALMNNGTCTWGSGYQLAFLSGDQMAGANTALSNSVPPGSTINVSVKMTAPTTNGTYKGIWQMQNASNQKFGIQPYVLIKVGAGATVTPGGTLTPCTSGTCKISGNLGATGSHLSLTISNTTGVTGLNVDTTTGDYSFNVTSGWSGTITPKKGTYVFSPSSYTFSNVTTNMEINFSASQGPTSTPTATKTPHP